MSFCNPFACLGRLIKVTFGDHSGTGHRIAHSITTVLNIPLVGWLIYTAYSLKSASYEVLQQWMAMPVNLIMGTLFIALPLTHFALEIEDVLEDYISDNGIRKLVYRLLNIIGIALGVTAVASLWIFGLQK